MENQFPLWEYTLVNDTTIILGLVNYDLGSILPL